MPLWSALAGFQRQSIPLRIRRILMKTYSHLVFDIDGTLLDTIGIHMISLEKILKKYWGEDMVLPDLRFSFGIPGGTTMEILGLPDPEKAHKEWEEAYLAYARETKVSLFSGMREVLEELSRTEVTMGIITSKTRSEYQEDFDERGLGEYFSCVVTASDTPKGKPFPDPMLEYLKCTGAKPEEVLYFGDSIHDMQCAREAGVDHALVLWGSLMPEEILATYRLKEPKEILSFVGS